MSETQRPIKDVSVATEENARVGYQATIDLWAHEEDLVWARFNVMLVAHSIIIAVIGLITVSQRSLPVLMVSLPIVGLILCVAWFLFTKRGYDYQRYFIYSARELEERYLFNLVKTVSRGGFFAKGDKVNLIINGEPFPLRISIWGRLMRGRWLSYVIIIVFVAMYIATFF